MPETSEVKYSIRNLRYTIAQLILVVIMMLLATKILGLVCYNMVPGVNTLLLNAAGATPVEIALILTTIPQAIGFFLTPLISTCSDKTRTRYGRRKPYLLWSAPALVLVLLGVAWSPDIAELITRLIPAAASPRMTFYVLAFFLLAFSIVWLFPGSVVYYLVADVIPRNFIGRFQSISTIATMGLTFAFNFFILKYTVEYTKTTFCILCGLYLLVYILIFFLVDEGEYPPVEDKVDKNGNALKKSAEYIWMFFRQCFQYKIFIFLFLASGLNSASNICRGMFNVLFATEDIGMSVETYGKIMGIGALISAVAIYFIGKLMDKTHPLVIFGGGGLFIMFINVFSYFFIHTPATFMVIGVATQIMYAFQALAGTPLQINIVPADKYGQFSSANSLVNAVVLIAGSWAGGWLTQRFGYRVMFIWDFIITGIAMIFLYLVYLEWKRFGGRNYVAPQVK